MIIDLSNPWAFLGWYFITAGLLFAAYKTKKALFCLIPSIYFLVILAVSIANNSLLMDVVIHRIFNFTGLAVSLSMFLVIDEVETRRKVISQVFKNRYKKKKNAIDDENDEEDSESDDE
jgi:hypothetical protein